jgi:site-specific DNA-adenine methylase
VRLDAPFPWFGGKRQVAAELWRRFAGIANYVEPFFGSGAVLLRGVRCWVESRRSMTWTDMSRTSGAQ